MKYTHVEDIGSGGFGIVDQVISETGEIFARKTFSLQNQPHRLPPELVTNVKARFRREAIFQSDIKHKNIVPVLDHDLKTDPPFFIMPQAICSLEADLKVDKTIGGNYLTVIMDIIAGLEAIHRLRVFHRDLKPGNVLKYPEPEDSTKFYYSITDFGLMSQREAGVTTLTNTDMQKGSDFYTAPEIANGLKKASPQSDIYSLGCILHDMVSGSASRVPFQEINERGPFGSIIHKCTKLDPNKRFKSVNSLRDAIISEGDILIKSAGAKELAKILEDPNPLSKESWESLLTYIEENKNEDDCLELLRKLSSDQITSLCIDFPLLAPQLGTLFSEWTGNSSFPFSNTDGLASRLEIFISHCQIETKVECLMAMLYLGTSHNRFYVEDKFTSHTKPNMDADYAKRLALEFRVEEDRVCHAIHHLEKSINFNRNNFHPELVSALKQIC